jgi:hypothetical protein
MSRRSGNPRCDHCNRRVGGTWSGIERGTEAFVFCGDRRACRRACREEASRSKPLVVMPPESSRDMQTETYGAALAGFDYVDLPWWMAWLPDRWLDGLRRDVAVKVGGIVERRCFLVTSRLEDSDV